MDRTNFRVVLLRVSDHLTNHQLDQLKFLSRPVIANSRMDRVRQALDLFNALEERGRISAENVDFLRILLVDAGCDEALKELPPPYNVGQQPIDPEYRFRRCLLRIASDLSSTEFDKLKFSFKERLRQSTDRIYSAADLFQLLIQRQIVTSVDLKALYDGLLVVSRNDLTDVVNQYMMEISRQPYQSIGAHPASGSLHRPVQETPTHGSNPQFPTISSGVRTNQGSPASSMHSHPSSLSSSSMSTSGESGASCLTSPPAGRVDSGHRMSSMPSASSMATMDSSASSHASDMTNSSMNSQHAAYVYNGQAHTPQGGAGQDFRHPPTQQQAFAYPPPVQQGYAHPNSPPVQPGYNQPPVQYANVPPMHLNQPPTPVQQQQYVNYQPPGQVHSPPPPSDPNSIPMRAESLQQGYFELIKQREEGDSEKQQLQKELAEKDYELQIKETDIGKYQNELHQMRAHIDSVTDEAKGREEEYQQKITDLENVLKRMTTEAEMQRRDMEQRHKQLQVANPRLPQDDDDFYKMKQTPHGVCLIINNYEFHHRDPDRCHPTRGGANVDVHNLSQTFRYLRYKIELVENVPSHEMNQLMLRMANRDHSQYDSFVCCILTHGERDVVHGSDCEAVNLNDLAGVMKMCPSLHGKPKIFFIQACRGEIESKGIELPEKDTGGGPYHNTIPQESDFYFGFATPIGNSAYRSRRYGSWFISEVCQVFIKHAYTHDLGAMMVKVNKRVSDAYTKDGYKQSPESVNRLRFQLHFFRFVQSRGIAAQ